MNIFISFISSFITFVNDKADRYLYSVWQSFYLNSRRLVHCIVFALEIFSLNFSGHIEFQKSAHVIIFALSRSTFVISYTAIDRPMGKKSCSFHCQVGIDPYDAFRLLRFSNKLITS